MNVSLTEQLEKFIQKKVASGLYTSASEVVREALRLLEEQERTRGIRFRELRRRIDEGWEASEQGQVIDGPTAMRRLVPRARGAESPKKKRA